MRLFLASDEEKAAISKASGSWPDVLSFLSWETELDVLDSLREMLERKLDMVTRPTTSSAEQNKVRPQVRAMIEEYRKGTLVSSALVLEPVA